MPEANSIFMKQYVVTMPDGSRWSVPVQVIAEHRAAYYASVDNVDIVEALWADTVPMFEADPGEIHEWAAGNMDWADVVNHAQCVDSHGLSAPGQSADMQEGWMNGECLVE